MEDTKKTTSRGRKPKEQKDVEVVKDTIDIELESKDDNDMIAKLMAQMEEQAKAMAKLKEQVDSANKEKSDLQSLVELLKNSNDDKENNNNIPKRIKIISLVPNMLNLTTQPNGRGIVYTFDKIGDSKVIKTSDLEDILSISGYRKQAEEGYFYIDNKEFIDEQGIEVKYNKDVIEDVCVLGSDVAVDVLCSMDSDLRDSIVSKIADNINKGVRIDRNRLFDVKERIGEDIESVANKLKKVK